MSCCSASSLDSSSLFPLIWSALLLRKPVVFQVQRVHLHLMLSVCTTRLSSNKSRLSMICLGSLTSFYPMKHSTLMDIPSWASTRTVPPCPREHPGPSVRGIDVPRPTCFREHGEVPDVDVLNGILVNDASLDDVVCRDIPHLLGSKSTTLRWRRRGCARQDSGRAGADAGG